MPPATDQSDQSVAGDRPTRSSASDEREAVPWFQLCVAAVAIGVLTTLVGLWLYPHTSVVVDERVYLQQSIAIEHGQLTMPPDTFPFHKIFFTYPNASGAAVFKYQPLFPALLAATRWATGTDRTAVALVAAGAALGVGALTHELLRRRRVTVLAAVAFGVSPMFLVVGSARLAYGISLSLVVGAAAAMLAGLRSGRPFPLISAGALFGLAFFNRPFDALVFVVPIGIWWIASGEDRLRLLSRRLGWLAVGAAPPLILMLVINRVTTGDTLTLPYSFVGPLDQLGFGPRLDIHDGEPFEFTAGKALLALRNGGNALWRWTLFGPFGLGCLAWASWRTRRRCGGLLFALALSAPLAYFPVWGTWNGYVRLRAIDLLGPMYWLTIAVPIAISIALAVDHGWTERRRVVYAALAVGLATSIVLMRPAVHRILNVRPSIQAQYDVVRHFRDEANVAGSQIVVITEGDNLLYRDLFFNRPDFSNNVVGALDQPGKLGMLFDRFPSARFRAMRREYVLGGRPGHVDETDELGFERSVREETLVRASGATLRMNVVTPGALPNSVVYVRTPEGGTAWGLPTENAVSFELNAGIVRPQTDLIVTAHEPISPTEAGLICVGVETSRDTPKKRRDEMCFDVESRGASSSTVVPGRGSTLFPFGSEPMLAADVSDRLVVDISGDK